MQFFKENRILLIWFALATCVAVFSFETVNYDVELLPITNDTLIYFSFSDQQKEEFANLFENLYQKGNFNGMVLVGQKDSVFYQGIYGYSNFALRDTLTHNSSFQLASVSKQFTAVAILQLYQKGLLNLNDSIQRFIPDFPYKDITIHQLLVHRSGLPNYHYFLQHTPPTADTNLSNSDVINEMIQKKPEAYYKANRRYHYSNTGYAVLAAIVEIVSKQAFEDYMQENIFSPLKMNHSFAYRGIQQNNTEYQTTGYLSRLKPAEDNYLDGVLGDKGIYCSAEDLFKWDQGLYKNTIINFDTLQTAFQPLGKPKYYNSNYGYGWRMFNWNDSTKVLFHAGWWHGHKSLLIRIPKDSTTIIVLKNQSLGIQASTKTILNIFYPKIGVDSSLNENDSIPL